MKRVVAFGTFDILHPGHIAFLEAARRLGTHLTVVVARDVTVRREKGRKPIFSERDRLAVVRSLRCVDRALLGDRPGSWRVLRRIRPDIVVVGFDQSARHPGLDRLPRRIKIKKIKRFGPRHYRSSHIKTTIL